MGVILILFATCCALALVWSLSPRPRPPVHWRIAWVLVALTILTLAAVRTGGSDWDNYEALFLHIQRAGSMADAIVETPFFEPGYVALNHAFSTLSSERRWLVVFEAMLNAYAIWLILRYVRGGPYLLVWLFPLQFANILGVRQTLATSVFVIGLIGLHGTWGTAIRFCSIFIHLSSAILILGTWLRSFRTTLRSTIAMVALPLVAWVAFDAYLSPKIANYLENAADLTEFSGVDLFIGKLLTLGFLLAVALLARGSDLRAQKETGLVLYGLATAVAFIALAFPPLGRLSTPIEFLIAWDISERIGSVYSARRRLFLVSCFVFVAGLKMLKISLQLGDIYDVCFACG